MGIHLKNTKYRELLIAKLDIDFNNRISATLECYFSQVTQLKKKSKEFDYWRTEYITRIALFMFLPIKSLKLKNVYFPDNKKQQLSGGHKGNKLITEHFSRHMARSIHILKIHRALKERAKFGKRADENNSRAADGDAINNSIPISGI